MIKLKIYINVFHHLVQRDPNTHYLFIRDYDSMYFSMKKESRHYAKLMSWIKIIFVSALSFKSKLRRYT